jgi:hypothetical protein
MKKVSIDVVAHELDPNSKYLILLDEETNTKDEAYALVQGLADHGIKGVVYLTKPDGVRIEVVPQK